MDVLKFTLTFVVSGTMQSLRFVMENRLSYLSGLLCRELLPPISNALESSLILSFLVKPMVVE